MATIYSLTCSREFDGCLFWLSKFEGPTGRTVEHLLLHSRVSDDRNKEVEAATAIERPLIEGQVQAGERASVCLCGRHHILIQFATCCFVRLPSCWSLLNPHEPHINTQKVAGKIESLPVD